MQSKSTHACPLAWGNKNLQRKMCHMEIKNYKTTKDTCPTLVSNIPTYESTSWNIIKVESSITKHVLIIKHFPILSSFCKVNI
jgi:hypothetical protein